MVNAKKVFSMASSYLPSTLTLYSSFIVMIYHKSSLKLRNDSSLVQNTCLCCIILHYPYRPPVKGSIKKFWIGIKTSCCRKKIIVTIVLNAINIRRDVFLKSNKNTSSQSTVILNKTIKAHIKPILQ